MSLRTLCFLPLLAIYFAPTFSPLVTGASYPLSRLFQKNLSLPGATSKCTQKDLCTCVRNGIEVINLHFLDHGTKPRFNLTISGQLLQWNPCTGFASRGINGVAVSLKSKKNKVSILGFAKTATFAIWNGFDVIYYRSKMANSSQIILQCNAKLEPKIAGFSFDPQKKTMNVIYTGPCRPKPSPARSSLSNGSVVLIVVLVLIVLYLTIGFAVNTYVRKFDGFERIPNYEFWKGLPSLIKDGCIFIFRRRKGYESM